MTLGAMNLYKATCGSGVLSRIGTAKSQTVCGRRGLRTSSSSVALRLKIAPQKSGNSEQMAPVFGREIAAVQSDVCDTYDTGNQSASVEVAA